MTGALVLVLTLVSTTSRPAALAAASAALLFGLFSTLGLRRTGEAFVLLAMFSAPAHGSHPIPPVAFVTFADLFFLLGFGLLVPTLLTRAWTPPPLYAWGAVVLVVTGVLAALAAPDPSLSFNMMLRLVTALIALPVLFMLWGPDTAMLTNLARVYVLGVALSTTYGFIKGPGSGRYAGLAEHPNELGLTALFGAAMVPFILTQTRAGRPTWFWRLAGVYCLVGIWISGSRAALLVLIILALVFPVLERSVKAAGWVAAAAAVGLAASARLLQDKSDNALGRLLGSGSSTGSNQERQGLIRDALGQIRERPLLGHGFADALTAHVIYLEIAVCVGIIGAIGYLMLLGSTVMPLLNGRRPLHLLAYPALSYVLVGFLTNVLWDRYIWAAVSLALVVPRRTRADDAPRATAMMTPSPFITPSHPEKAAVR